jgi:repressor LexA
MKPLTERQQQVFDFITAYLDTHGCPPTLREISEHIQTKGTVSAIRHLDALESKGWIQRRTGSSRSITLTGRITGTVSVPIVGRVRAGVPTLAIEEIEGYCSLDKSWVPDIGCFFLRVVGDSMIEDHILEGDLALIRPQVTADDGDIVVAMIDDEATLKRFYRDEKMGTIMLEARNPKYHSYIFAPEDVTIIGKLIRTVRNYS